MLVGAMIVLGRARLDADVVGGALWWGVVGLAIAGLCGVATAAAVVAATVAWASRDRWRTRRAEPRPATRLPPGD